MLALACTPCRANTFNEKDYNMAYKLDGELSDLDGSLIDNMQGLAEGENDHLYNAIDVLANSVSRVEGLLLPFYSMISLSSNMFDSKDEKMVNLVIDNEATIILKTIASSDKRVTDTQQRINNQLVTEKVEKYKDIASHLSAFVSSIRM